MLTSSKKKGFKNIMCGSSLSLLLLLLIGRTTTTTTFVGALLVGDDICTHGYIMDYFCINNKNMLDNRKPTLEKPMDHTVHCLLDVGICTNSDFEVLIDPVEQGNLYTRGYRLTEQSKQSIIALGRNVGSCSTCDNGYDSSKLRIGFRAVMKAIVLDLNENDDDAPPLIEVSDMQHSNDLGSDPCQSVFNVAEGVTSLSTEASTMPPTLAPYIKLSENPTLSSKDVPNISPILVPSENPTLATGVNSLENVPSATLVVASDSFIYNNCSFVVCGIIGFITFWLALV